jgi:hypothetical protein
MPYRRPLNPPEPKILVPLFEAAIKSLVRRFRNHPYVFYTESDMHCYLYHRMYVGGLINGLYSTVDGDDTVLLHKEYPTLSQYSRLPDGKLEESGKGRRGHFDICLWDPQFIGQREHRKQKVLFAAELALNECRPRSLHTINDTTKLAGPRNEIRFGYLLFFVRDDPYYERRQLEVRRNLDNAARRLRVVLAVVNGCRKPKPEYFGPWGEA